MLRSVVQTVGRGDEVGSVGQSVFRLDQQVFKIGRDDHVGLPPRNEFCVYYPENFLLFL